MEQRYTDLNTHLKERFGCRVQKITVDAGLSCPNRDGRIGRGGCIYCNARGSGTGAYDRGQGVAEQILEARQRLARRYKARKFIAYFQSFSNTYAPVDRLEKLYREALSVDGVVGLSVGTRPDCVDAPVLDLLASLSQSHLLWVELGLQSAHDATLARINRGHDSACFLEAVARTRSRGIPVCAHVILGLPGEERRHMMETARFVADSGVQGIKLHLLYVVRGTPMERLYRSGAYRCLEQEEYVALVCDFLERIPEPIVVHRLTGDPHPEELVAPAWSIRKGRTLERIRSVLEARGSRQGCRTRAAEDRS